MGSGVYAFDSGNGILVGTDRDQIRRNTWGRYGCWDIFFGRNLVAVVFGVSFSLATPVRILLNQSIEPDGRLSAVQRIAT